MIQIINPDLFNIVKDDKGNVYYNTYKDIFRPVGEGDESKMSRVSPRTVLHLVSKDGEVPEKMSVKITKNDETKVTVKAYGDDKAKFDTPVFLIAMPYDGLIRPIKPTIAYRVYKCMTMHTYTRNIPFNDERYSNLMYMAIVPNVGLFSPEHKYHTDTITASFTTYKTIYDDVEEKKVKGAVKTTMFVNIKSDMSYEVIWKSRPVDPNEVESEDFKGKPLYVQYLPPEKPKAVKTGKGPKNDGQKSAGKGNHSKRPNDNYQKNTSIRTKKPERATSPLDSMIKNALETGNSKVSSMNKRNGSKGKKRK